MADMTPADMSAVLGNRDGFAGEWFWIIIILFAFFGNGFGANNGFNDIARESTMNTQFVERDIAGVNTNVLENRYANQLASCETQKDVLLGNANLQKDILLGNQTISAQMATCCLKIINKIVDNLKRNLKLCIV